MNTSLDTDLDTDLDTGLGTGLDHRHDDTAVVLAALSGLALLAALVDYLFRALVGVTGHPRLVAVALVLIAAVIGAARWVARRVRERREDAADLIAGAAWRAQHMPHLATETDRDPTGGGVMWSVTGWVIATWLRVTFLLSAAVAVCWLALGMHSGAFWLICCGALGAEVYLSRQLLREWGWEAGLRWWWGR